MLVVVPEASEPVDKDAAVPDVEDAEPAVTVFVTTLAAAVVVERRVVVDLAKAGSVVTFKIC